MQVMICLFSVDIQNDVIGDILLQETSIPLLILCVHPFVLSFNSQRVYEDCVDLTVWQIYPDFIKVKYWFYRDRTHYFLWIGLLRTRLSAPYKTLIALMNSCCLCEAVFREAKMEQEGGDLTTSTLLNGAACEIAAVFFCEITDDEFFCSNCLYEDRDPKKRGIFDNFVIFLWNMKRNSDYLFGC